MKKLFKIKKGTILTEALISMFILGTLFVSIATAVTVSISNTRKLQEVNETSIYAQKIVDCIYSIAQSDSGAFFEEIRELERAYEVDADFSQNCEIKIDDVMSDLIYREDIGREPNIITLYDLLNFDDDGADPSAPAERSQYYIDLYLLPSYNTDEFPNNPKSVNYFISYNPYLTSNTGGGRIFNVSQLDDIYTFKLVVSKTENYIGNATTNYIKDTPASVTYIFQISSNGG